MRRAISVGIVMWGIAGAAISVLAFNSVNPEARGLVVAATVVGVAAAFLAFLAFRRGRRGLAMALLAVSIMIPTYFAWVFSLLPLIAIAAIALSPRDSSPSTADTQE